MPSANLEEAIVAAYNGANLAASCGPIRTVRAFPSEPPPQVVCEIVRGAAILITDTSAIYEYTVTFRVRALKGKLANEGAQLLWSTFNKTYLNWTGGHTGIWEQNGWPTGSEPRLSAGGDTVFWEAPSFLVRVKGPR